MAVGQVKVRDGVRQVDAAGRRWYTQAFKAQVVTACRQPGASVARVALEHGLNANLVRKWLRQGDGAAVARSNGGMHFVPVIAAATDLATAEGTCAALATGKRIEADTVAVVELGSARIRIGAAASPALVHAIMRALR
jgi:transposase-like protein